MAIADYLTEKTKNDYYFSKGIEIATDGRLRAELDKYQNVRFRNVKTGKFASKNRSIEILVKSYIESKPSSFSAKE